MDSQENPQEKQPIKNKGGRRKGARKRVPSKASGTKRPWTEVILDYLAECPNIAWAAYLTGVTRDTVMKAKQHDPVFRQQVDAARQFATGNIEASLFKMARTNNVRAKELVLKHRLKEVYGPEVTVKGDKDAPLGFVVLPPNELSEDEWTTLPGNHNPDN